MQGKVALKTTNVNKNQLPVLMLKKKQHQSLLKEGKEGP